MAPRVAAVRRKAAHWAFGVPSAPYPSGSLPDAGPGNQIGLTVEIFVNSAWTDISSFVYYKNRVKITRGKPNESSQIQPQMCTFTINNRDGRFSPRNPLGPYYLQIGRNTPVRVSRLQNGIRRFRFYGEVPSWPTQYDISGTDVFGTVTAAGQMRRLFQGNQPLRSALFRTYALNPTPGYPQPVQPITYWPCEEGANSTQIASGLAGGAPLALSGQALPTFASNSSFPCSASLPLLSASIWTGAVPAYTTGSDNVLRFLLSIPSTGAFDTGTIATLYTGGTVARLDLQYGSGSNGQLSLTGYDASGTQLFSTGYQTPSAGPQSGINGMPVFISMELQSDGSGNVQYGIRYLPLLTIFGVAFTTFPVLGAGLLSGSTLVSALTGHATSLVINPGGHLNDTAVGHVIYQSTVDALSVVARQFNAWTLDTPSNRFLRLCAEQGVSAVSAAATGANAGDLTTMGYQANDTFTNLVQEPASSSAAMLFESRDQSALAIRERGSLYNQAAHLTLDHSAHQLSGPLAPVDDDALTRNDVTATRISGSSVRTQQTTGTLSTQTPPAGVGDYATNYSLSLGSDALLADQAGWRLHLGTVDQPRFPNVPINLRHPTFTSSLDMMNAALTIDIGDRLVITNPPPWMPPDPISQIVLGYSETLGAFEHDMVFNCAPEDPYKIGILEDVVLGRADADGSVLAAPSGAADVTLLVGAAAASNSAWTVNTSDFPFDVNIGGERVTVTSIAPIALGVDGSFESGVAGWTLTSSTLAANAAAAHSGALGGLVTETALSTFGILPPQMGVVGGATYMLGFWMKLAAGAPTGQFGFINWFTSAVGFISTSRTSSVNPTSTWANQTFTAIAPANAAIAQIGIQAQANGGGDAFYVDDVALTLLAGGTQTFTVTRSVNGVVKAQTANTDVRLWQPMYLSL